MSASALDYPCRDLRSASRVQNRERKRLRRYNNFKSISPADLPLRQRRSLDSQADEQPTQQPHYVPVCANSCCPTFSTPDGCSFSCFPADLSTAPVARFTKREAYLEAQRSRPRICCEWCNPPKNLARLGRARQWKRDFGQPDTWHDMTHDADGYWREVFEDHRDCCSEFGVEGPWTLSSNELEVWSTQDDYVAYDAGETDTHMTTWATRKLKDMRLHQEPLPYGIVDESVDEGYFSETDSAGPINKWNWHRTAEGCWYFSRYACGDEKRCECGKYQGAEDEHAYVEECCVEMWKTMLPWMLEQREGPACALVEWTRGALRDTLKREAWQLMTEMEVKVDDSVESSDTDWDMLSTVSSEPWSEVDSGGLELWDL